MTLDLSCVIANRIKDVSL